MLYSQGEYTDVKYPVPGDNFFGFKKDDLRCIFRYHYQDIDKLYHSKQIFLSFHWPRTHYMTCKYVPTSNGLLMRNVVYLCLGTNNVLLMHKINHTFLLLAITPA